jgi:hypothetical protein
VRGHIRKIREKGEKTEREPRVGPWWGSTFKGTPWRDVPDWWLDHQLALDDQPPDKRAALEAEQARRDAADTENRDAAVLRTKLDLLRQQDDAAGVSLTRWLHDTAGTRQPQESDLRYYQRCLQTLTRRAA